MNNVRKLLNIDKIHNRGIEGKGVTVAILDSGIIFHKDIRERIIGFYDLVNSKNRPYDDNGHGTHIAGIFGGNGISSNGKYKGICPKANIVVVKVLDKDGKGKEEDVVTAAKWILENRRSLGINIVNISFGAEDNSYDKEKSELVKAVELLWDEGIIVVAAAGNGGPKENTITAPGISKKIITVGALDDARKVNINGKMVNDYSGRGSNKLGYMKPEVIAPATMIYSCGNKKAISYIAKSGTSMAVPIVSGCIGLLLCKYPGIQNCDIKALLRTACRDRGLDNNRQGYGLIDPIELLKL